MFETYMTVIGNVANNPDRRATTAGEVISFRLGSTTRYWSEEQGKWRDGSSLFLTVNCWRKLVHGVGAAVMKGSPVIAHGPVRLREYTTADGQRRSVFEMRAVSVGLDLARCLVTRIDQQRPPASSASAEPGVSGPADGPAPDDVVLGGSPDAQPEEADGPAQAEQGDALVDA